MAQQINLYTPSLLREKKHFSAAAMLQTLSLLLAAGLAFYAYALYETSALEKIAADSGTQLKVQTNRLAELTRDLSPQGKSRQLEEELARSTARLGQLEELSSAMRTGGLGNTAGFSRYLAALARQPVNGVWLTDISIGGDESALALGGRVLYADLVPAYVRALSKEEVMRGRRISDMRLTAREEDRKGATQAPGAKAAEPGSTRSRYVEFRLTALKGGPVSGNPARGGQASESKDALARPLDESEKGPK